MIRGIVEAERMLIVVGERLKGRAQRSSLTAEARRRRRDHRHEKGSGPPGGLLRLGFSRPAGCRACRVACTGPSDAPETSFLIAGAPHRPRRSDVSGSPEIAPLTVPHRLARTPSKRVSRRRQRRGPPGRHAVIFTNLLRAESNNLRVAVGARNEFRIRNGRRHVSRSWARALMSPL